MSKFNKQKPVQTQKTINLAGGEAYKESDKLELVSLLLTSFAQNSFYEKEEKTNDRLIDLIKRNDPLFVAKSAIYARNEFGMRSISHITASEVAKYISGASWGKQFFNKIVRRPDDMLEILSYYLNKGNKISNSMKKGFAEAFNKFDTYQLSKYRGEGKTIKLVDLINIVHPIALTDDKYMVEVNRNEYIDILKKKIDFLLKNKKTISVEKISTLKEKLYLAEKEKSENIKIHSHEALVIDLLRSKDTFESELSAAGQKAKTSDEKVTYKREAWEKLLNERKIGYMALLKNLRNIIEQAPNMVDKACALLTDVKLIKNSLVLPFRFTTAFEEIEKLTGYSTNVRKVMNALNDAIEISMDNVPKFDDDTLLVIDVSGSMHKVSKIASLFGSVIIKRNDCDVITFDTTARYVNINSKDSISTISKKLSYNGGGTDFHTIFNTANKAYSRVIILSDMQGWVGYTTPTAEFNAYCKKYNCKPHIFSFDLAGNGSLQFPENKVYALAGFSDKVFDIMKLLETDRQAMIHTIEAVEV